MFLPVQPTNKRPPSSRTATASIHISFSTVAAVFTDGTPPTNYTLGKYYYTLCTLCMGADVWRLFLFIPEVRSSAGKDITLVADTVFWAGIYILRA